MSPTTTNSASDIETLLTQIRTSWSLSPDTSILPTHLHANPENCSDILDALVQLANLTPSHPERAWSLINTYFQARIREAGNNAQPEVVVEDVMKACESAQRMSKGRALEGKGAEVSGEAKTDEQVVEVGGKRKYSIRDEQRHVQEDEDEEEEEVEVDVDEEDVGRKRKYSIRHELRSSSSKRQNPNNHQDIEEQVEEISHQPPSKAQQPLPTTHFRPILPALSLTIPPPHSTLPLPLPNLSHTQRRFHALMTASAKASREADRRLSELEAVQRKVAIVKTQWQELVWRAERLRGEAGRVWEC